MLLTLISQFTKRPLKRSEMETGIVLGDKVSHMTTSNRVRGDVLSLCSPVIDVADGPDGRVSLFHFTAVESVSEHTRIPTL